MTSKQESTGKVAIYCRVATPEQTTSQPKHAAIYARAAVAQELDHPHYGIVAQIETCKACCTAHGYTQEEEHIYQEIGPADSQLDAVRKAAYNREIDPLVIFDYTAATRYNEKPLLLNLHRTL